MLTPLGFGQHGRYLFPVGSLENHFPLLPLFGNEGKCAPPPVDGLCLLASNIKSALHLFAVGHRCLKSHAVLHACHQIATLRVERQRGFEIFLVHIFLVLAAHDT